MNKREKAPALTEPLVYLEVSESDCEEAARAKALKMEGAGRYQTTKWNSWTGAGDRVGKRLM